MPNPTTKFLIFALFSAASLIIGYYSRKKGILSEHASRHIHLWTIIGLWSPITLLAFWEIPLDRQLYLLFAMQLLTLLTGWLVGWLFAKWLKLSSSQTGMLILCAALSNQGFTLGAYLCYTLFEPAAIAMSYAIAYVTAMQVFMVLIFYPIARYYGPEENGPVIRLIASSFFDIRAMPIYMAIVGLLLNWNAMPYPQWVKESGTLDVLIFTGGAGGFIGIGLRLRLGDTLKHLKLLTCVGGIRFVIVPLVSLLLLLMFQQTAIAPTNLIWQVLVVESCMPMAINSVIVANLFHLDARLGSSLWLGSTVAFVVLVLPIILWWF